MNQKLSNVQTHVEALESRLGLRLAAHLQRSAESLPPDITERLRFGREQALERARASRRLAVSARPEAAVTVQGHASLAFGGPPSLWLRLASALPLVALVAGLVLIQQHHDREQISAAAEIDTALLSDELPPAAYGDPGFAEYLRNATER